MTWIYKTSEGQRLVEEQYRRMLAHWPVANRQFTVPTKQGETFVIACGDESAAPVMLLHGALANSATWMEDVPLWANRFRVFAIDVIGEPGLSAPSRPPLSSEAYVSWLDDVMSALSLEHASYVGMSLGGWLALDYATRRPERVDRMVLVCPGGVGRQKIGVLFKIAVFNMFGPWGKRRLREAVLGPVDRGEVSPAMRTLGKFFELIHKTTKPRRERLPVFSDEALKRLTMPVLAIVGAKDALFDSAETRRRIESLLSRGKVKCLDGVGHLILGQGPAIAEFLNGVPAELRRA